jgi:hypothetical protein
VVVTIVVAVSAAFLAAAVAIRSRRDGRGRAAALAELSGAFERPTGAHDGDGR